MQVSVGKSRIAVKTLFNDIINRTSTKSIRLFRVTSKHEQVVRAVFYYDITFLRFEIIGKILKLLPQPPLKCAVGSLLFSR